MTVRLGRYAAMHRPIACVALLVALAMACAGGAPSASDAETVEPGPTPTPPGLPDGRVYELVSPAEKSGNEAGRLTGQEGAYGVSAGDGERVLYASSGAIGEADGGVDNYSVSERTPAGWRTRAALPPPVGPIQVRDPVSLGDPTSLLASSDLTKVAFTARNPFTLSGVNFSAPEFSFSSVYLTEAGGPATWIGSPTVADPHPTLEQVASPANLGIVGASADLSTVYFEYYGTLVPEDQPRVPTVTGGSVRAWGLYEWREGRLKAAGLLPTGEEDPSGAQAAGIGERVGAGAAPDYGNEVSRSGNMALFVSPAPGAESGRPPQLYARVNGSTTVLLSRSELTGHASLRGVVDTRGLSEAHLNSYAYASPDGSRAYFTSEDQLTADAPAGATFKEYQFDLTDNTLTYLPGVNPPILGSSEGGGALVFLDGGSLAVWEDGHVNDVATLPEQSPGSLYVSPVRFAAGTSSLTFQTNAPIPGFNNGGYLGEIYTYGAASGGLTCVSCPPEGQSPVGGAELSNDALHHPSPLISDSRSVSEDGSEIFFDTPDRLVPQDHNEARDVYAWHAGRLSLISPGTGATESLFLDNSASGSDVFFTTKDNLVGSDTDGSFDVYDARVGGGFPTAASPSSCSEGCLATAGAAPAVALASAGFLGAGDQIAPPPPVPVSSDSSRAEKLTRSLKACRKKHRGRRRACEAQARRRYGRHLGNPRS